MEKEKRKNPLEDENSKKKVEITEFFTFLPVLKLLAKEARRFQ
jgi:hypothetical protein